MNTLGTTHGRLDLPAFLPDATRAVARGLTASDLRACGIQGLMVNALHLAGSPGTSLIRAAGGVHRFMGWPGVIASDSGGFQAYSMLAGKPAGDVRGGVRGVSDEGIVLRLPGRARTELLTPEKSIRQQLRLGADILFCLDQCTHPLAPAEIQHESVRRTIAWARRCRATLDETWETASARAARDTRAREEMEGPGHGRHAETEPAPSPIPSRPLLFAVVQGGNDRALRRACCEELAGIGFDGYGFGGWPVDERGELLEMVAFIAQQLPPGSHMHGLGIGKPDTLVAAWRAGYQLFDCVIPTRDGRHGRLFRFREDPAASHLEGRTFYDEIAISDARFVRRMTPVEPGCRCPLCDHHPASYLHHLFRIRDTAGPRLATMHNLVFYARLIHALQGRA
jgi:queuine tRNA-ribosyltransferase